MQALPLDGSLECIKQDNRYGIRYIYKDGRAGSFVSIFNGVEYEFLKDPSRTWSGFVPLSSPDAYKILGKIPLPSEALAMAAAHQAASNARQGDTAAGSPSVRALGLYQKHVGDKVWADFLEDAKNTFHVGGIMMA